MNETRPNAPIQPVDKPIINPPYDEPKDHWVYSTAGQASRAGFRRAAGYWYKTERTGTAQKSLFQEEQKDDLTLVNLLRDDVRRWRESNYRGASKVTQELLRHWASDRRPRRLFFCQREAVETIVYLAELRIPGKSSRTGFKNFELTDDNLQRLLRGERPEGGKFDLAETAGDFYPRLVDIPLAAGLLPLRRLGCKMATGSGKTVVMAMLIAWAFCNRGVNRASAEFPDAVLVCCPNLTVKERLQVLRPEDPENYYAAFDLVPAHLRPYVQMGKVLVTNWHPFAEESEHKEGDKSYAVVNKGPETPETLARRVLGDLYDRLPILVLNDEGHHCWRPAPPKEAAEDDQPKKGRGRAKKEEMSREEKAALEEEQAEARVWLEGLDRVNNCRADGNPGITMCVDLSATPFYLQASGYPEGQPFPWLVSDFGLVDAIESGIVKIPRLPVKDDRGLKDAAGRPDPLYFRLWHNIVGNLQPSEKYGSGKPKPEFCYRDAEGALKQLAGQWVERFEYIHNSNRDQEQIPPVLIVVCDNTEIADYFFRKISGESESDVVTPEDVEEVEAVGEGDEPAPKANKAKPKKQTVYGQGAVFPEYLSNTKDRKVTIRIDSKLLAEAESEGKNRQAAAEELRRVVATVGGRGQPGEHVRCVVSVSMLTEGWDANNVTHVLGIRAFLSQLLCEQVVGRGLRRINYEPDPATGLLTEEYVDVYGIPFSVIPFKGRPANVFAPEDKPKHRVWALPEREEMEIKFPYVNGYVLETRKGALACDVDKIEPLGIDPRVEPTASFLRPTTGYADTQSHTHSAAFVRQDRGEYYAKTHFQSVLFQIAQRIVDDLLSPSAAATDTRSRVMRLQSRHVLFPQVFDFVRRFAMSKVNFNGVDRRELGLEKYVQLVVERVRDAIVPDASAGEPPLLPILDRYRPYGKTGGVDFPTTRPVCPTKKSHLNLVVLHSSWEADAMAVLDASDAVKFHARNDHLGLVVKYDYLKTEHDYEPDFLVRLANDVTLVLEIKGYEVHNPEQIAAKHNAARRWVLAVNNLKDFGEWGFVVCRDLGELPGVLAKMTAPEHASVRAAHLATKVELTAPLPEAWESDDEDAEDGPPLDLFGDPLNLPTAGELVVEAFTEVRDGWSSEYVVCSPEHEGRFHGRIKQLQPNLELHNANLMLWNARRSGKLSHLKPSKQYSPPAELRCYEFVCEWAYRSLIDALRRETLEGKGITLERILCVPPWRERFDELVQRIKPGFSLLDYRWLAMRVRKRSRKQPFAEASIFTEAMPAAEAGKKLPDAPGVYLIRSEAEQLYTGWATNLREQANRLVDAGQGDIIPGWLLVGRAPARTVAFEPMETGTIETRLHDLWRANLRAGRPVLNLLDEPAA